MWAWDALVLQRFDRSGENWCAAIIGLFRSWKTKLMLEWWRDSLSGITSAVLEVFSTSLPSVDFCGILSILLQSIRPHLNNESLIIIRKVIQGWRATGWLNAKSKWFLRLAVDGGCDRTCHDENEMSRATSTGFQPTRWRDVLRMGRG